MAGFGRAVLGLALLPLAAVTPAQAAPAAPAPVVDDVRELQRTDFTLDGRKLPAHPRYQPRARGRDAAAVTPPIGTVRQWLGLDQALGSYYRKSYVLRGSGDHIELWVAEDLAFPAGDCRGPASSVITDAQVDGFVHEFDKTIYPAETGAFSTPPDRDGSNATLTGVDYTGAGNKTVTLVDNVRDSNYAGFPAAPTYIAGFFSAQLNELFDRNVMTIDSFDWAHRSGAAPPSEPTADLCTSRPARPRLYEAVFAHEWQHLLQYNVDPAEVTWINEGLSDYAQTLTGYVDPSATVHHAGADSHLFCYQGFGAVRTGYNTNPQGCGGAQNSLNLWNEGAPPDVLADYGIAYEFMLYLRDRFGAGALSRLHRDGARHGLAGVAAALPGADVAGVVHDFQTMTLVDKIVEGGRISGISRHRATAASLRSTVNLADPGAYDTPGAAPNGADFVRLRGPDGAGLKGDELTSVVFAGAASLPAQPLRWSVRDGALFSGNESKLDAAAVIAVTVPVADPTLRMKTRFEMEQGYDYGYVTVSADGGHTYTAVAGDATVAGTLGPALTGGTVGFEARSWDLSAYAGKNVLLGLRYVTDSSVNQGGWLVKALRVGAVAINDGSSLAGFRSPTQIVPTPVHNWDVRLVGITAHHARQVPVAAFARLRHFDKIVAIVGYDDPTEQVTQYAPYTLTVNGSAQPGS